MPRHDDKRLSSTGSKKPVRTRECLYRDVHGVRRCAVCNLRALKRDLLRVVVRSGILVLDLAAKEQCRGAYVHADMRCVSRMADPERWDRVLRAVASGKEASEQGRSAGRISAESVRAVMSACMARLSIAGLNGGVAECAQGEAAKSFARPRKKFRL